VTTARARVARAFAALASAQLVARPDADATNRTSTVTFMRFPGASIAVLQHGRPWRKRAFGAETNVICAPGLSHKVTFAAL
jgi:hypothetical protein